MKIVKAQVLKAQQAANYQREDEFEDEEDKAVEEVENEFEYNDGGEEFNWSTIQVSY